ncbi:baculoviral IAP repeat-containing protein 3-like [Ylistrum balloti]|uniref:baculoviral IAP repeat-containing protein 3-like n=1 Tax=Ylistrum balloti TaxID=509963 RepID=UPI002905C224|nr:baculoviral IAP repeat-containing protein 3-like [Ylistrum balloti]
MGGLLASKSEWIVNDEEELQIEAENFFRPERCTYFNKVMKRLETFLPVCSGIDCDSLADAGFYYTGENIRCFTCGVVIVFGPCTDDYWVEHAKTSPGCSYVRTQKGAAYIHNLLSTEVNSESHPDDVKGKRALLFETYLDPDGSRFYDTGTAQSARINTVLRGLFGCLELFPDQKFQKEKQRPSVIVGAKYLLKGINDARVQELRYLLSKEIRSKSTEVFEFIRLLGEQPRNRGEVHVFIVQNVMSRLSSYRVWPHRNIRTGPLVEAGFSCKEPQTCLVKCMSCGLELNASTLNDTTPLDYHRTQSPDCEFFNERNSPASDGHQIRTSNDLSTAQVLSSVDNHQRAMEYAAQTEPQINLQSIDSQGQSRSGNKQEENDTPPQMPTVPNDGNIHVDEATLLNDGRQLQTENSFSLFSNSGAGVSEPLIAERPRTGQGFDRTSLPAPDNNVTSRGEAVTENENVILGAEGNDNSFPIRNPRYTEENARRETFTHWPHRSSHDIDRLVNCGFFYTGAEDIVRCFYCDIGLAEWNPDDDPWVEHARHSPECPYLRAIKGQDYINNIQTQWARIYTPKHPQHSQVDTRRRTFNNEAWPRDNVLQTPDQLAAAGFFYTGEGDTVRCHYCDGGLREWEPEDNPWVEHARWFPFCKFVLKIKGIDFIQASATGNPTANGLPTPAAQQVTEAPLTMSFVEACRIRERRNPLYSAAAQSIRTMGYSKSAIKMIIDLYIARTGRRDFNATHLMDIVMEMEDAGQQFPENDGEDDDETSMGAAGGNIANIVEEEMELSPAAMKKENEYLKMKFKCKVCERQERCIVFVPCGHRVTCQQCGERADVCIHCKSRIDQRYKTYLS